MQQRRDKDDRFAQALLAGADALATSAVLAGADALAASAELVAAATAEFAAAMHGAGPIANAYVIRAGEKPRYGTPNPNWRKSQFIQAAITADHPHNLPDKFNHTKLTEAVNARLLSDPAFSEYREGSAAKPGVPARRGYGSTPVTRQAVITALRMLRAANP